VVLKPGAEVTEDELKAFVKDKLAPYKYPRQIEFVERAAQDGHRQDPALQAARASRSA
jgi:acyl-CoA synthetase (AMP-forming)/AMP-acid ligase II